MQGGRCFKKVDGDVIFYISSLHQFYIKMH